jgi:hypothetical protein
MKLKTIKHIDGKQWAEIHTTSDTDAFVVRTFAPGGKMTKEIEIPSTSIEDVQADLSMSWAIL